MEIYFGRKNSFWTHCAFQCLIPKNPNKNSRFNEACNRGQVKIINLKNCWKNCQKSFSRKLHLHFPPTINHQKNEEKIGGKKITCHFDHLEKFN